MTGTRSIVALTEEQLGQPRAVLDPMPDGAVVERQLLAAIEDDRVPLATVVRLAEQAVEQRAVQPSKGNES